jgi:type VI protein secretion system component VasK
MENKNMALKVSGFIFLMVAIMHLLRLFLKVQVHVGSHHVRLLVSLVGFVVALLLAIWMFAASKK